MPIRLVLADDHPVVLDGLSLLCSNAQDMTVLARCVKGDEALEAVRRFNPDVLILDLAMPGKDGLTVLRELRDEKRDTKVVVLTAAISDEQMIAAMRLGVRGVVLKELAPSLLLQCVRRVAAGGQWLETQSTGRMVDALLRNEAEGRPAKPAVALTARERELVRLVVSGMRNKEIGERLSINEGTVKAHLYNVYQKLGVTSRVQMAMRAKAEGLA